MTKVVVHACGDANSWKRRRRTRLYIWNGCKSGMGATPLSLGLQIVQLRACDFTVQVLASTATARRVPGRSCLKSCLKNFPKV